MTFTDGPHFSLCSYISVAGFRLKHDQLANKSRNNFRTRNVAGKDKKITLGESMKRICEIMTSLLKRPNKRLTGIEGFEMPDDSSCNCSYQ